MGGEESRNMWPCVMANGTVESRQVPLRMKRMKYEWQGWLQRENGGKQRLVWRNQNSREGPPGSGRDFPWDRGGSNAGQGWRKSCLTTGVRWGQLEYAERTWWDWWDRKHGACTQKTTGNGVNLPGKLKTWWELPGPIWGKHPVSFYSVRHFYSLAEVTFYTQRYHSVFGIKLNPCQIFKDSTQCCLEKSFRNQSCCSFD